MNQTSQQTTPTCALGLTSADLSAWRDEALAADETARIGAHSESCPACQQRLLGFALVAATLQAQQIPAPDERLWRAVLAALSTGERMTSAEVITDEYLVPDQSGDRNPIPHLPTPQRSWRRRALGTLAAVAAIALVVVGFGRLFQSGAQNRPSQTFSLTWRQISLPGGMGKNLTDGTALSVFPTDGSIAWLCQSGTKPAPGPLHVWRTNDGGATWKALPVAQRHKAFDCEITPDQLDPDVVALNYGYIPNKAITIQGDNLITFDGGASWHDAPFFLLTKEFATINGAIYAIRSDDTNTNRLMVSRDGAQTWNDVDDAIHAQKMMPSQFWVNPNTSALLVKAISMTGDGFTSLWTVDINRNYWLSLNGSYPSSSSTVARSTTDDPGWNACTLEPGGDGTDPSSAYRYVVTCGPDAGSTSKALNGAWTIRPALDFQRWGGATPTPCNACGNVAGDDLYGTITLLGIANDGALLATAEDRFGARGQATRTSLYRLPAGASTWQDGGALPIGASTFGAGQLGSTVIFAPRPGGGMLWAMPDQDIGSHPAGPVFTASYPGPATPPLPTQAPTATLTPLPLRYDVDRATPLAWQPINMPKGFQASQVDPREPSLATADALAVAPSDGRTAYACQNPNQAAATQTLFWSSHNGGSSWTPETPLGAVGSCALIVDQTNPNDVLLGIATSAPHGTPDFYYRSVDGGGTWQRMYSLDKTTVTEFASDGATIYAFRGPGSQVKPLQASNDGMATWRTVDSAIQQQVSVFWLNPFNGELLASSSIVSTQGVEGMPIPSTSMWRSDDGGAHWNKLPTPMGYTVLVQTPQPNSPWNICLGDDWAGTLYCGDDSGQQWTARPALSAKTIFDPLYTALTRDGSILALSAIPNADGYQLYRLPPGADRWLDIGPLPEMMLLYAPVVGGSGALWSTPENSFTIDAQGWVFAVAAP